MQKRRKSVATLRVAVVRVLKSVIIWAVFTLLMPGVGSQPLSAQALQWAKRAGGTGGDRGFGIAADGASNSYVTGGFSGTATFDGLTLIGSGFKDDIFIVKFDPNGNPMWAKNATGGSDISSHGIAVDGSGNSYVTGEFGGLATFGFATLASAGSSDIFVAKYDPSGNGLWAKRAGGTDVDAAYDIAVDAVGNSYVTGRFFDTATFGSVTITSAGAFDIFVAKYDASGNVVWAKSAGGSNTEEGLGIAVDAAGNSYVTGRFFGTVTLDAITLTSAGASDIFVAKYDASGNVVWAKSAGGTGHDFGNGIAADAAGNNYVTGGFLGAATFDGATLTSAGFSDIFVVKYDADGNLLWVKSAGGTFGGFEQGEDIAVDGSGNSYVTGLFTSNPATFGGVTLTNAGDVDIFLVKYDASGNAVWAKSASGADFDHARGVAVDAMNNSYVTGDFPGTTIFDGVTLTSAGSVDIFVAKYSGAPPLLAHAGPDVTICAGSSVQIGGNPTGSGGNSGPYIFSWVPTTSLDAPSVANPNASPTSTTTYTVTVTEPGSGLSATDQVTVRVEDNEAPVITPASTTSLWPPNHQYVTVSVSQCVVEVSDNCANLSSSDVMITQVTSDEPENADGNGDGNTLNDIVIASDCQSVQLRREREGSGNGRVYTIHLSVGDGNGNTGTATCLITVPKSQNGDSAVDDGPAYTVTSNCSGALLKDSSALSKKNATAATSRDGYALFQNEPNPFNPSTLIQYDLPNAAEVKLEIFDMLGRHVRTLVNQHQQAGRYAVIWDGRNEKGEPVASGAFFYQLRAGSFVASRKAALLR